MKDYTKRSLSRPRYAPFILSLLLLALVPGCTQESDLLEPLPVEPPDGAIVTGVVTKGAGHLAEDVVVVLENMENGQAASVRSLIAVAEPVEATVLPDGSTKDDGTPRIRTTVTDRWGKYSFQGVAVGDYLLTSSTHDHLADSRDIVIPIAQAAAADTTFVDIHLTPTGTFFGNATRENATNHRGTVVFVDGTSYVGVTDPAGDYFLAGVPVGAWTIAALYPHYLDQTVSGSLIAAGDSVTLDAMYLRLDSNIPPTATITSITGDTELETITFAGSAIDSDGDIVLYEWDFEDDGVFDSADPDSATATHVYTSQGDYRIKFRVTDDRGGTGLAVADHTIIPANILPVATATEPDTALAGSLVTFDGTGYDEDGVIVLYEWDFFDDGSYDWAGTHPDTAIVIDTAGSYQGRFRVTDDCGGTDDDEIQYEILPGYGLVIVNDAREWEDGTHACSCNEYRNAPAGYAYHGETGNGPYRIDPGSGPLVVYCDMTTDNGGWTMVGHYRHPASDNGPPGHDNRDYALYMRARLNDYSGKEEYLADPNSPGPWTDWRVLQGVTWPVEFAVILDMSWFMTDWENYQAKIIYRVKNRNVMPNYSSTQDLTSGDNLYYKYSFSQGWSDVGGSSGSGPYYWWPRASTNYYLIMFNVSNGYYSGGSPTNYHYSAYYGEGVPGGNNSWHHGAHLLIRETE